MKPINMRSVRTIRLLLICVAAAGILIFLRSSKTLGSQTETTQECLDTKDTDTDPGSNVLWDNLSRQFVSF